VLPGQPPTFRQPSASERPWWWRLEGEIWAELAEHGVAAVTLFDHDRQVYGPMSLSA
jgi:hypothetical protein